MRATEAGYVALRLVGLVVLVYGIVGLVQSLAWFLGPGADVVEGPSLAWMGVAASGAFLVQVLCAGLMIVYARKLSSLLFGSAGDLELSLTPSEVLAVGFALAGAWVAMGALPSLGTSLAHFLWILRAGAEVERESFLTNDTFLRALYDLLQLGVGVFFFARSRRLAGLWSRGSD